MNKLGYYSKNYRIRRNNVINYMPNMGSWLRSMKNVGNKVSIIKRNTRTNWLEINRLRANYRGGSCLPKMIFFNIDMYL